MIALAIITAIACGVCWFWIVARLRNFDFYSDYYIDPWFMPAVAGFSFFPFINVVIAVALSIHMLGGIRHGKR